VLGARGEVVGVCGEDRRQICRGSAFLRGRQRLLDILWPQVGARDRYWSRKSERDEGMNPELRGLHRFCGRVVSLHGFVK